MTDPVMQREDTSTSKEGRMRRIRVIVPVIVLLLVAAACSSDTSEPSGDTGTTAVEQLPNTGNVNRQREIANQMQTVIVDALNRVQRVRS